MISCSSSKEEGKGRMIALVAVRLGHFIYGGLLKQS
jgi:hypothetical protein